MVLIKRRKVELFPPPTPAQKPAEGETAPTKEAEVYYLRATGEIFSDYEYVIHPALPLEITSRVLMDEYVNRSYAARMTFFQQPFFSCEVTGRQSLSFLSAQASEQAELALLARRFPEPLKRPVLRTVQFRVTGRLDGLVDLVNARYKERFFCGEAVHVDIEGDKYYAKIVRVFPPKHLVRAHPAFESPKRPGTNGHSEMKQRRSSNDSDLSDESAAEQARASNGLSATGGGSTAENEVCHAIGGDLDIEEKEALQRDDPMDYLYHVKMLNDEAKFTGSVMEVRADKLSRDRLTFSKAILRKYLREAVERDASLGAAWHVRPALAAMYGIPQEMSLERKQSIQALREGKLMKRKKSEPEVKNGKRKKGEAELKRDEERARQAEEDAARKQAEKERAERRRLLRYPCEDLLLEPISERELAAKIVGELPRCRSRVVPSKALPVPKEFWPTFSMVWNFVTSFGKPLGLSAFTMDEFEGALRYNSGDPPCQLIVETHAVLLNAILRETSTAKGAAVAATMAPANGTVPQLQDTLEVDELAQENGSSRALSSVPDEGAPTSSNEEILRAARKAGGRWEKARLLRYNDGRTGWENLLVGCLAALATPARLPSLMGILSHLTTYTGSDDDEAYASTSASPGTPIIHPDAYPTLSMGDKLAILAFLCDTVVLTKPIRAYLEECEALLTELRKEKIELSRERKRLLEDWAVLEGEPKPEATTAVENGEAEDVQEEDKVPLLDPDISMRTADEDMSSLSEAEGDAPLTNGDRTLNDDGLDSDFSTHSDAKLGVPRTIGSRQAILLQQKQQRRAETALRLEQVARERAAHKARSAESRQIAAERRRLEEEAARIARREEAIEREFRKHLYVQRQRPLGMDRFFNRYWWFDGIGVSSILTSSGVVTYGTGHLFVQGPAALDLEQAIIEYGDESIEQRRSEEEDSAAGGLLGSDEWACYSDPEEIELLYSWLRVKGNRENALKAALQRYRPYIGPGMRKRQNDLTTGLTTGSEEVRRSARSKVVAAAEAAREPFLAWKNTVAATTTTR